MPLLRILTAFRFISSDASFTFLTVTCGIALYRARRQPWTALFVASAYLNLTLLLLCLRLLDGVPRGDLGRRRPLEFAVVALAAALNATLCYQVTKLMPPAVSALLWLVAAVVSTGGALLFYGRHRPRVNRA